MRSFAVNSIHWPLHNPILNLNTALPNNILPNKFKPLAKVKTLGNMAPFGVESVEARPFGD